MGAFNGQTPRCRPGSSGNNWPVSGRLNAAASACRRALSRARVFVVYTSTASEFKRFTGTRLLAQFDKDVKSVMKMSLKFSTGNVFKPKYKLRVLRVRLTPVEGRERWAVAAVPPPASEAQKHWPACLCRPLCRYDIVVEEDREVTFRPLPCQDSNFWDSSDSSSCSRILQHARVLLHKDRIKPARTWSLEVTHQILNMI